MNPSRLGSDANYFRDASTPLKKFTTNFDGVESLTRQDQAHACNINNIYKKTQQGQLSLVSTKAPVFGDFTDVGSYDVVLETINKANEQFMSLPSDVRAKFNNDPSTYYERTVGGAIADVKAAALEDEKRRIAERDAKRLKDARELVAKNDKKTE